MNMDNTLHEWVEQEHIEKIGAEKERAAPVAGPTHPEEVSMTPLCPTCKGWRWMPGMRTQRGLRLGVVWDTYNVAAVLSDGTQRSAISETVFLFDELPDITDPATLGCLLALVREAWGQDDMGASRYKGRWCVEFTPQEGQHHAFYGDNEAEALVAALEGAPNVSGEHRNRS
jgi:hypothetical protein